MATLELFLEREDVGFKEDFHYSTSLFKLFVYVDHFKSQTCSNRLLQGEMPEGKKYVDSVHTENIGKLY